MCAPAGTGWNGRGEARRWRRRRRQLGRWRRQLGGSVACAAVVAARQWGRRQRQHGGRGQLCGGGGSLAEVRLRQWRQRFGKHGGSAAVAAAVQRRQRQLCVGGQLQNTSFTSLVLLLICVVLVTQ
jgi:hypothetical protein